MTVTRAGSRLGENGPMRVLIVDDSAVVRQTVSAILHAEDIDVSTAADPYIAMQKIASSRPDVILLDIEMPRMNGLTFLEKIMSEDPIPVVILSALAGPTSETAFQALRRGAVDVVAKPKVGLRDFLQESCVLLVDTLRAASVATLARRPAAARPRLEEATLPRSSAGTDRILALGASTGGTEALRTILSALPAATPGTVIVQHMPEVFTAHFARSLDAESNMSVKEAADGDRVIAGRALVAPGNRHMELLKDGRGYFVKLSDGPLVSRHRPSVDVLFHSTARAAGNVAVGVILTGMGADGAEGMLALRRAGARTIAQDEETSVVFGMPREAIVRGAVEEVLPLSDIAAAISSAVAVLSGSARRG